MSLFSSRESASGVGRPPLSERAAQGEELGRGVKAQKFDASFSAEWAAPGDRGALQVPQSQVWVGSGSLGGTWGEATRYILPCRYFSPVQSLIT